jgi:periplasmic nitrate reductase NapE
MSKTGDESLQVPPQSTRKAELFVFATIVGLLWPVIAVGVVGGYGFIVWMWQIIFGPPGPPGQ